MPRILLLLALFNFSKSGFGQFHSFFDTETNWIVREVYQPDWNTLYSDYVFHYFDGDTTINDTVFKQLKRQRFYRNNQGPGVNEINDTLQLPTISSYFFEDVVNQLVFVKMSHQMNKTRLVYNYGLSIGDTLLYEFPEIPEHNNIPKRLKVIEIEEVPYLGNEVRKKIHFESIDNQFEIHSGSYIIESLGGQNGLCSPFKLVENDSYQTVYCVTIGDDSYDFFQTEGCSQVPSYVSTSSLMGTEKKVSFNNPVNNNLVITNLPQEDGVVFLFSLNGNKQLSQVYNNRTGTKNIVVDHLAKGVYVLVIINSFGEVVYRNKILKQ